MNSEKADYADQATRIKNLENNLKVIEGKLTIALNQSDVFKNTMIDLGTIVTKVDKSLKAVKQSLSDPNQRIQHIEGDLSGLSLQTNQMVWLSGIMVVAPYITSPSSSVIGS